MARKTSTRQKRPQIPTIIGAGITEQWHFTHLQRLKDYRVKIRPRYFGTETANGIGKKIEEVLRDDGIAICVFDADVSSWNEAERRKWDSIRKKYKNSNSVVLCDSLPSIEYWFLLHYENTNRYFGTSKSVTEELRNFVPQYDKSEKFLQQEKWVADMIDGDRLEEARNRAETLGTNGESYTNVHKAISIIDNAKNK